MNVAGVASANAVFARKGIKEAFVQALAEDFGARARAYEVSCNPCTLRGSASLDALAATQAAHDAGLARDEALTDTPAVKTAVWLL